MGETGDPWGISFFTGFELPLMPSTHIAALRLSRKFAVHLRYSSGMYLFYISERRHWWFTKSKKPLMSKVSADVTMFWFQAVCTSCTNVMAASIVKEFDHPPNCVPRISLCLPTMYDSLFATIFSSSLPRHSNKVMRRYAQGCE